MAVACSYGSLFLCILLYGLIVENWTANKLPTSSADSGRRVMQSLRNFFFGPSYYGTGTYCCYDNQYRPTYHDLEQRYVSPTAGRCKPLVVQAVHPGNENINWTETNVRENTPRARKLAIWLMLHPPFKLEEVPVWFMRWAWFTLALIWPFNLPKYTGRYPVFASKYYRQLWIARCPREYSLRDTEKGAAPIRDITHGTYPRRLVIYDDELQSWRICTNPTIIKEQRYVTVSYRREDFIPAGGMDEHTSETTFIGDVETVMEFLNQIAYWLDLALIERGEDRQPQYIDEDVYRMADVYRGAEFTLIMLNASDAAMEQDAWRSYGQRLWTFPEALLSRELRFKFRHGELANRAYTDLEEESAIINAYGLRDPLERLQRLSLLKSALWRRTSTNLRRLEESDATSYFRAERVYALMGFFEHRIHPHPMETEFQALLRLSMVNDNDHFVERIISFLPHQIRDTACWYAEEDEWGTNLWDIEPEIALVGMTCKEAVVLGGCRAAAIRWKDFPSVSFAMRRSYKRLIANFLPNIFWEMLLLGISLEATPYQALPGAWVPLVLAIILMLFAPFLVAYGTSGRIVQAQPWLVGVKGLISAEEASTLMYGGAINALPRLSYSPTGTLLSRSETEKFRRGDPAQLKALMPPGGRDTPADDDLYTLIDTLLATIYYFRATRPPTVCLYTGWELGMGRFVLCSERCISQSMEACDWVALS